VGGVAHQAHRHDLVGTAAKDQRDPSRHEPRGGGLDLVAYVGVAAQQLARAIPAERRAQLVFPQRHERLGRIDRHHQQHLAQRQLDGQLERGAALDDALERQVAVALHFEPVRARLQRRHERRRAGQGQAVDAHRGVTRHGVHDQRRARGHDHGRARLGIEGRRGHHGR
jgi:hypothetical protein